MNKRQSIFLFAGSLFAITAGILLMRIVAHRNTLSGQQIQDRVKVLQGRTTVPVIPNKSEITAEVLNVERGDFPQVLISLRILESKDSSEFSNLLKPGEIIKASPQYIYEYKAGTRQIIFNHPQNIQNFQLYYVLAQDQIKAIARATGGGQVPGGRGAEPEGMEGREGREVPEGFESQEVMVWSITDIKRLAEQGSPDFGLELSPAPVPIVPNRSKVTGSVLKVEKKDYPEVELSLRVVESRDINGFSNFLGPGVVITARPYYLYEGGTFTPSEPQNSKNLLAYYLLVGDTIEAEATLRANDGKTGRGKLVWIISDLERVNHETR